MRFFAGSALAYAVALALTPVLTRLYPPAAFGTFSILLVAVALISSALNPRWDMAIPSAADERGAGLLAALSFLAAPVSAVLGAVILWIVLALDALPKLAGEEWAFVLLAGVLVCVNGWFSAVHYTGVRRQDFGFLGAQQVTVMAGRLAVQMGMGLVAASGLGLATGEASGRSVGTVQGLRRYGPTWLTDWRSRVPGDLAAAIRSARKFSLVLAPSTFIDAVGSQLPALLIATNFGLVPAGLYAVADKIVFAPVNTVGRAAAEAYHSELARQHREAPEAMMFTASRTALAMLAFGALPLAVFLFAGPSLFSLVFGESWREAGQIAALMSLMTYAGLISYPLGRSFQVTGRQEWKLIFDVLNILVAITTLGLGRPLFGLGFHQAMLWYSVLMMTIYGVSIALALVAVHRAAPRPA